MFFCFKGSEVRSPASEQETADLAYNNLKVQTLEQTAHDLLNNVHSGSDFIRLGLRSLTAADLSLSGESLIQTPRPC